MSELILFSIIGYDIKFNDDIPTIPALIISMIIIGLTLWIDYKVSKWIDKKR